LPAVALKIRQVQLDQRAKQLPTINLPNPVEQGILH
jgi:hypothetical protein